MRPTGAPQKFSKRVTRLASNRKNALIEIFRDRQRLAIMNEGEQADAGVF